MTTPQPEYYATIPQEPPSRHPGRTEGIIGIICAVISLAFFPIIFGPVGIILGAISSKKGSKTLGLVTIILSAVFMVIGFIIGAAVYLYLNQQKSASIPFAEGAVISLFSLF